CARQGLLWLRRDYFDYW
nr:immunoglobulin heavy chain junction region [Mus musculus]